VGATILAVAAAAISTTTPTSQVRLLSMREAARVTTPPDSRRDLATAATADVPGLAFLAARDSVD